MHICVLAVSVLYVLVSYQYCCCGQVLNAAWDLGLPVVSENSFPCYDRDGYSKILDSAKPRNDPDGRHLSSFTYLRLSPVLMQNPNFLEFERFVKQMHGKYIVAFMFFNI